MSKKIDEKRLRGWAREAQQRIEELEHAVASLSSRKDDYRYDPVPRHPIPLKDRVEFYKKRDRLRKVQIWTSAGKNERGERLLCSLDWPEPITAIRVYLATHDMDHLEAFGEWLSKILGGEDDQTQSQ